MKREGATIGDLAQILGGGTPSTRVPEYWSGDIPWFTPSEIPKSGAGVVTTSERTITQAGLEHSAAKILPAGSVLMTSRASIGHCAIAGVPVATNQGFTSLVPKDCRSTRYLYYWAQYNRDKFLARASGSTFLEISASEVRDISIDPPALEEQRAIGDVLTSIDRLIRCLEQLIVKKQSVKQGMMQQLLTGRTRLPGFEAGWTPQKLGNLLSYQQPGPFIVSSDEYRDAGTPVLTAGKSFLLGHTSERQGIYRDFPVIIFDDFTTSSQFVNFPFKVKSSAMKILSARPGSDLRYLYERMQLIDFIPADHKRRWIAEFSKIELLMPRLDEQTAIAAVLNDVNREIDSLRKRLEKARDVKTGMMQQLLTGRVRLPVEVAV